MPSLSQRAPKMAVAYNWNYQIQSNLYNLDKKVDSLHFNQQKSKSNTQFCNRFLIIQLVVVLITLIYVFIQSNIYLYKFLEENNNFRPDRHIILNNSSKTQQSLETTSKLTIVTQSDKIRQDIESLKVRLEKLIQSVSNSDSKLETRMGNHHSVIKDIKKQLTDLEISNNLNLADPNPTIDLSSLPPP